MNPITFAATVARVRTMADGGLRFEFDIGEDATMQAAQLMECKRFGSVLEIECKPLINNKEQSDAISEGQKRKSRWETAERASL